MPSPSNIINSLSSHPSIQIFFCKHHQKENNQIGTGALSRKTGQPLAISTFFKFA